MPSADFCSAVRPPFDSLSPLRTRSRSPGVSSAAFCAGAPLGTPDLRFAPLMDMDFAVSCPLVRRWRLISGSCPSTRTFAIRFFQTPPRGGSPCVLTSPSPPSGWAGDLHPPTAEHAQHTTKPLRGKKELFSASVCQGDCATTLYPVRTRREPGRSRQRVPCGIIRVVNVIRAQHRPTRPTVLKHFRAFLISTQ